MYHLYWKMECLLPTSQTKASIFNNHFVEQCSLISNDSVLPNRGSRCYSSPSGVEITGEKILSIIRSLDPKKAHGWDDISINMIKLCDTEIVKPLYLIYTECLETGRFPSSWKKANVLPIYKKENRQLKKNYRPISLLPIAEKFLKSSCLTQFTSTSVNHLLTPNQSGFRPGDSTVNQLLSITHQIYSAFEEFPSRETRAVFLDISKAFDKVWHDGLLFKLKNYGISDFLFTIIKDLLANRQQRVVLNRKSSCWFLHHYRCASRLRPWSLIFLNPILDGGGANLPPPPSWFFEYSSETVRSRKLKLCDF